MLALPANDLLATCPTCSEKQHHHPCRRIHERKLGAQTKGDADKESREERSCGRSQTFLYNEERPHQALGNATPADCYQVSSRRFDGILRSPEYGDQEVRWVRHNGEIKLDGKFIYISAALAGEPVGLAESESCWTVTYGPIRLGTIAYRADELRKPKRKGRGLGDNAARCPQGPQPQQQQT